ncbi:type IV fimbrial biogenesis protein FimT [Amphritea atlantica]|uniref:Type II secretion system protein H n=1 Tax=Amphritea atlantica TaxID=355243 RepID=A0A1H9LM81_9GAMM|nr:GspH/FimT family pseudopilin [Amphritea atlantica]SER12612.1 type IV fimbrial biogenesis protein FimT [Amphritea atlantica]
MSYETETGVTLIELLVALSVLAILLTVGVPSLAGFVSSQKLDTTVQLLKDSYSQARYEAVTQQRPVFLCPLDIATGGCGNNWSDGVVSYHDLDGDNSYDPLKDTKLLQNEFPEGVVIEYKKNCFQIKLTAKGTTGDNGTFAMTVSEETKTLVVSGMGRIRNG